MNDVILPKWAATPEDFIIKHREALVCICCNFIFFSSFHLIVTATSFLLSNFYIYDSVIHTFVH